MSLLLVYCFVSCLLAADGVTLTFEMNSHLILKGSRVEFSCSMSVPFNSNSILIWKGDSIITTCSSYDFLCDEHSINFTANINGAFGSIRNVTTDDEGIWKCSYSTDTLDYIHSNTWNLSVYAIPSNLKVVQSLSENVDLSERSLQLRCKTIGCSYPIPKIEWIFKDQTTLSENVYATVNPTETEDSCHTKERIYTSTLYLPTNTTLNDNRDTTGTFSCRMVYPDASWDINASASNTVRFAVRVTEAFLQHNNQNVTEALIVNSEQPVTLTCVTGTSRPAPTIDWYVGYQMRGSGASVTITFTSKDHNEKLYCQANNIRGLIGVSSAKARLLVREIERDVIVDTDVAGMGGAIGAALVVIAAIIVCILVITRRSKSDGSMS